MKYLTKKENRQFHSNLETYDLFCFLSARKAIQLHKTVLPDAIYYIKEPWHLFIHMAGSGRIVLYMYSRTKMNDKFMRQDIGLEYARSPIKFFRATTNPITKRADCK